MSSSVQPDGKYWAIVTDLGNGGPPVRQGGFYRRRDAVCRMRQGMIAARHGRRPVSINRYRTIRAALGACQPGAVLIAGRLARAAEYGWEQGWAVGWESDWEYESTEGQPAEVAVLYAPDDESDDGCTVLGSLGGIVGADANYRKLIEAELMLDAMTGGTT